MTTANRRGDTASPLQQVVAATGANQRETPVHGVPASPLTIRTGRHAAGFGTGEGRRVTVFLASHTHAVDKKGRVSVPAPFRNEMAAMARQTVVVYAAPEGGYLYGWAYDDFVKLAEHIQKMPPLSPARQRLARSILAAARPLGFDDTGRIMLPPDLIELADLKEKTLFAGQGEYFTIWNPERFAAQAKADAAFMNEDLEELSKLWPTT